MRHAWTSAALDRTCAPRPSPMPRFSPIPPARFSSCLQNPSFYSYSCRPLFFWAVFRTLPYRLLDPPRQTSRAKPSDGCSNTRFQVNQKTRSVHMDVRDIWVFFWEGCALIFLRSQHVTEMVPTLASCFTCCWVN